MKVLSAVVPCFNEEENIKDFYDEFIKAVTVLKEKEIDYELLFVDDGSTDDTVLKVKELKESDSKVHLVSFSRNFGKEAAIYAGLEKTNGDYVVFLDADLQDPPSLLPEMFSYIEEGYDCVATRRVSRKGEPPIRSFFARRFYKIMKRLSKTEIMDGARDYRLMTRQVADAVVSLGENNRFSKGLFGWVGFNTKWIEFENVERRKGETKWSFWKLFMYSLEGIASFSTAPLGFAAFIGGLFCFIAFVAIIFVFVRALVFGDPTSGWPSMVCIILFVSGIQLFCLGIVGQYLAKTYTEVKNRPKYIVKEEI